MRYRMMALYRGVPYEAGVGPSGGDVVLFAACPPPEELGFEPATGHWRKRVIRAEVDTLWESRPVGVFHGEPCMVLDDLGDRLHVAYLGNDTSRASALGYWQIDRGVFELLAPREEVTGLTEERVDRPLLAASARPAPEPQTHPYQDGQPYESPAGASFAGDPLSGGPLLGSTFAADSFAGSPIGEALASSPLREGFSGSPIGDALAGRAFPASPAPQQAPAETFTGNGPISGGYPPSGPAAPDAGPAAPGTDTGGRAGRRQRVSARDVFCQLADLAAIPRSAYALEAEVDGALCLTTTPNGFDVFVAADGARHEVRSFVDEEAAYFYLFGVLSAEAVRTNSLIPAGAPGIG